MLNTLQNTRFAAASETWLLTAPPKLEDVVSAHSCTILERISATLIQMEADTGFL